LQLTLRVVAVLVLMGGAVAEAQVTVRTTNSFYSERGGGLESQIIDPSLVIRGDIKDVATIRAGWSADVVSGASVAVVDAPGSADVVTSATRLTDFRNTVTGAFGLRGERTSIEGEYTYGHESDYRSHGFRLTAAAELFERNTRFELSYGRGFDRVCNLAQPRAQEAVDRQRLPSSDGCFSDDETREERKLDLQTFQGAWTQAWTPIFATQLTLTAQVLNGYQGNPYRAVWLGNAAAQENHPENRARFAGGLVLRLWLPPFNGALHLSGRVYRDTWDVFSVTGELAYEQRIVEGLRVRVRGRYYNQTGAAFYSDDYELFPRGQYFTGDRELSPMSSWVVGARLRYDIPPSDEGTVGPFSGFEVVVKFDYIKYDFRDFRYGSVAVPNDSGILATLGLEARF